MLEGERVAALPENDQLRGTPISLREGVGRLGRRQSELSEPPGVITARP